MYCSCSSCSFCVIRKKLYSLIKKTEIQGWIVVTAKEALCSAGTLPASLDELSCVSSVFLYFAPNRTNFSTCWGRLVGVRERLYSSPLFEPAESYSWALIWKQLWGKRRRQTSNKQARRWCSSFYKIITAVRHQTSCQTASLMRRSTCWAGCNPDGCMIPGFHCERLSSANSLDTAQPPEGHMGRRSAL